MVSNFTYYTPTEVVFGKNTEQEAGRLVKHHGGTKVLLHYGSNSAKRSGLLDRVEASLKAEGIEYVELGGVVPNPRLSKVHEGIELGKRKGSISSSPSAAVQSSIRPRRSPMDSTTEAKSGISMRANAPSREPCRMPRLLRSPPQVRR